MRPILIALAFLAVMSLSLAGSRTTMAAAPGQVTLSYAVVGGGSYQPPHLTYIYAGHNYTVQLSNIPTTYTMDPVSTWYVSNKLPGSNFAQRWMLSGPSSGGPYGQSIVLVYYRQFYVTFSLPDAVRNQGTATPTVSYSSLGNGFTIDGGNSAWADYLSSYTYGTVLGIAPASRWYAPAPTGVVQGAFTINPPYTQQFLLTFSLSSTGPDTLASTTLMESFGGSSWNQTLTASSQTVWVDAASTFAFRTAINGPSGTFRWYLHAASASSAIAPISVGVVYYEQYPVAVAYTTSDGSSPSGPVVTAIFNGANSSLQVFSASQPLWIDAGSTFSISPLLQGSTSDERWVAALSTSGIARSSVSVSLEYFHQLKVGFSYSVVGGGAPMVSNATFTYFGSTTSTSLDTNPKSVWADYGSTFGVQGIIPGGSSQERWILGSPASVLLTKPQSLPLVYYHQIHVTVNYVISGGAPLPSFSGTFTGNPFQAQLQSGGAVWLDSGTQWNSTELLLGPVPGTRWAAVNGSTGTAGTQTTLTVTYEKEYLVMSLSTPSTGGSVSQQAWVPDGGKFTLSATPNEGWAFFMWEGTGQGSYSGRNSVASFAVSGPVQEVAHFDVGITVHSSGSGSVSITYGSTSYTVNGGSSLTFFVPQGTNITIVAKPGVLQTFAGWYGINGGSSRAVVMDAYRPVRIYASFVLDQVTAYGLLALFWGVAIYLIAYLAWKGRLPIRRSPRPELRGGFYD